MAHRYREKHPTRMSTVDEILQNFPQKPTKRYRNRILKPVLSSVDCLTSFFSLGDNDRGGSHDCDITKVVQFFGLLKTKCSRDSDLKRTVKEAMEDLVSNLPKRSSSKKELRIYIILPACHLMTDTKMYDSINYPFACSLKNLDESCQQILDDWLKAIPLNHLKRLVMVFTDGVRQLAPQWMKYARKSLNKLTSLESCLWLLDKIYKVNELRDDNLPEMHFHVPELCAYIKFIELDFFDYLRNWNPNQVQEIEMEGRNQPEMFIHALQHSTQTQLIANSLMQYLENRHPSQAQLHFCQFPFLFNGELKRHLLRIFNGIKKSEFSLVWNCLDQSVYLISSKLVVDRRNIIEDTLNELRFLLSQDKNTFKRELTVRFKGENDYGPGVDREFFTLVLQRLLSPTVGLFAHLDKRARGVWFHPKEETDLNYYHFAGFMLGLALYNSQLITVPFPSAVFKKLLGIKTNFKDLEDVRPEVAKSLCSLLLSDEVNDLYLTFTVVQMKRDKITTIELCENGKDIPVTTDNRKDYVRLMVDFYLNKETAEEFEQFYKGFNEAFDSEILQLLRIKPSELHSIFVGQEIINTVLLEKNAVYEGGYNHASKTIQVFWEIIHSLSQEDVKRFVSFVTGSERVSHSGLMIKICLRPALDGERIEDVMPEAITCFQQLNLPDIQDKERLQERLFAALNGNPAFTDYNELMRRIRGRYVMWT